MGAVEEQQVAAVYRLAPADAAAVVQRHERRAAMHEAQRVLHCHICRSERMWSNSRLVIITCPRSCTVNVFPEKRSESELVTRTPAHGAEPSRTSEVSRCGQSAALTSWWSRESHTGPYARHTRHL